VNAGGTPAANVEVLLLDEQSVPLAYVKTNLSGHFEFPGIALGSYIIWPEVTGLATSPAHITLNSTTSSVILPFSMTNNQVAYGICETLPDYFSEVGDIFPNPAAGALASITVTVTRELMIDLTLFNVTGQAVYTHQTAVHKGFNLIRFDVANLAKGPYYLQLRSSEGGSVVKKLSVIK
jgi:hypothetical protein